MRKKHLSELLLIKNVLDEIPENVYWLDLDHKFIGCNKKQAESFGLVSPDQLVGRSIYEFESREDADRIVSINNIVINSKQEILAEEPFLQPDGTKRIFISKKAPLFNKNKVIGTIGVSIDITAEKENQLLQIKKEKAEQKAQLMQFYETIIDKMPGNVYWKDINYKYNGCNTNQAQNLGLKIPNDIQGKTDFDLSPYEIAEKIRSADIKIIKTKQSITTEEVVSNFDGKHLIMLSKKSPLFDKNGKIIGIIGVSFDITAEKENQRLQLEKAKLEKQKAEEQAQLMSFYETILDLFPGHVYWIDLDGIILGTNKQQALTAGFENKKDIIGKTNADLPWANQAEYLKRNNDAVLASGTLQTIEEIYEVPGQKQRYFLSKKQPLRNEKNEIIGLLGVSFDITAEKEMQRLQMEKLQQEKEEAEHKVELMKILAGSIAHELRTPLGALSSYAQGISLHLPKLLEITRIAREANLELPFINKQQLETLSQLAESIKTEVQAGFHFIDMLLKNIQQDLRGYAMQQISLMDCIHKALDRYPFQLNQEHIVHIDIQKDIIFTGNTDLMIHVLFNLLKNALFYVGSEKNAKIDIIIPNGDENILIFRDNGVGIKPEDLPHIFEKFYSKSRHGTGVGLAFCRMVIENFSGKITCQSELGCYTEFIITFPKSQGENHGQY